MTNHPPSVLWHCWLGHQTCKNRRPYNLYCVGADVKPCSINRSDVVFVLWELEQQGSRDFLTNSQSINISQDYGDVSAIKTQQWLPTD